MLYTAPSKPQYILSAQKKQIYCMFFKKFFIFLIFLNPSTVPYGNGPPPFDKGGNYFML